MSDIPRLVQSWKACGLVFTLHSEEGRMHVHLREDAPGRRLLAAQVFILDAMTTRVGCWSVVQGDSLCGWWMREFVGRKGSGEDRGSLDAQEWLTRQVHLLFRPKELTFEEEQAVARTLQCISRELRRRCHRGALAFADRFHAASTFDAYCLWGSAPAPWLESALGARPALGTFLVALWRHRAGPPGLVESVLADLASGTSADAALTAGYQRFVAWAVRHGGRRLRAGKKVGEDSVAGWALVERRWPGSARALIPAAIRRAAKVSVYQDPWVALLPPLRQAPPKRRRPWRAKAPAPRPKLALVVSPGPPIGG